MGFFIFLLWILTGLLAGVVASDKGHSFVVWGIAGLFMGPLGLIASAGLSDKKLRQYIRKIGESQGAIKPIREGEDPSTKTIGDFLLPKDASEDQIWEQVYQILNLQKPNIALKADRKRSSLNEPLIGGKEFLVSDSHGNTLALAYAKENSASDFLWQIDFY